MLARPAVVEVYRTGAVTRALATPQDCAEDDVVAGVGEGEGAVGGVDVEEVAAEVNEELAAEIEGPAADEEEPRSTSMGTSNGTSGKGRLGGSSPLLLARFPILVPG